MLQVWIVHVESRITALPCLSLNDSKEGDHVTLEVQYSASTEYRVQYFVCTVHTSRWTRLEYHGSYSNAYSVLRAFGTDGGLIDVNNNQLG